jgi:ubiquinone/menaquinone biosynthesis C-methylase UbiE
MTLRRDLTAIVTAPLLGRVADRGVPDGDLSRKRYGQVAEGYDALTAMGSPYRRQTVRALAPQPGETVLDVGCGTGLNFELLAGPLGPEGTIVGIDLSPHMLRLARERADRHGWRNVVLVEGAAEDVDIPVQADAALLCGTHDIMRSPAALEHVLAHVRPGGRVVAAGPKWAPWWWATGPAMNAWTWQLNRDYVTTFEGFGRPWSHLARLVPGLEVTDVFFGGGYIAAGRMPPRWRARGA